MNRENKYFDENDFLSIYLFPSVPHSSIINRTRTSLSDRSLELIKGNTLPVPVISVKHTKKLKDPVKEFIKTKKEYLEQKSLLENRLARFYRTKKISKENDVSSKNLKEYIVYKYMDPCPYIDPQKDCFYYYPHRGILQCYETEDNEYLAHIGISNDGIYFDEICDKMPLKKINSISDHSTEHPTELVINENSDFIACRYRKVVEVAKLPEKDVPPVVKTFDSYEHRNDLFACALNDCYLTTIDSKYKLRRFNLVHRFEDVNIKLTDYCVDEKLHPISLSTPNDNVLKKNCASFTTRYNFGLLDFRNKKKVVSEKYFNTNDMVMKCENIFNHVNSLLSKDLVYIATSHLLYGFDYRKLKEPVVQWTHQLYEPAMMLTTTMHGLNEIICASSHMAGDLKIFTNNGKSINYYPQKPYNIRNSYNKLREQGLFLLSDNIKERINGSITGISLHSNTLKSKIKLFTQNCYGDVFESILDCKESTSDEDIRPVIEKFQLWENFLEVPFNPNKELTTKERIMNGDMIINDIVKLKSLPKYLHDKKCTQIIDITNLEPENLETRKEGWKIDISEARKCTDLLAKEIMYLWDDVYDSDDSEGQDEEPNNLSQETKDKDKVSRWLETTEMQLDNTFEDDFLPEATSTQSINQTLSNTTISKKKSRVAGF